MILRLTTLAKPWCGPCVCGEDLGEHCGRGSCLLLSAMASCKQTNKYATTNDLIIRVVNTLGLAFEEISITYL